jgi:cyclic beta-1,2-glucan synthetase
MRKNSLEASVKELIAVSQETIRSLPNIYENVKFRNLPKEENIRQLIVLAQNCTAFNGRSDKVAFEKSRLCEKVIMQAFTVLNTLKERGYSLIPGGEWLLDNFFLIHDQLKLARQFVKNSRKSGLPVTKITSVIYPRVYVVAQNITDNFQNEYSEVDLGEFLKAFQGHLSLNTTELWAFPEAMRVVLIEKLGILSARIMVAAINKFCSSFRETQLVVEFGKNGNLEKEFRKIILYAEVLQDFFGVYLIRQLQSKGAKYHTLAEQVESRLFGGSDKKLSAMIKADTEQAADQTYVGQVIANLSFISMFDWKDFIESQSRVHAILSADPAGVFGMMDFKSRNYYRELVAGLSRKLNTSEIQIAEESIRLANQAPANSKQGHVGYFLINESDKNHLSVSDALIHGLAIIMKINSRSSKLSIYIVAIVILAVINCWGLYTLLFAGHQLLFGTYMTVVLCLIACVHLSLGLVSRLLSYMMKPKLLPRLNFSKKIPDESTTIVVIPTIVVSIEQIDRLIHSVETKYIATRSKNLYFGLLTDLSDSMTKKREGDDELVAHVEKGINLLNKKYCSFQPGTFMLFHRPRRWNNIEKMWMGYERKRGKLIEFTALLRGEGANNFERIIGDKEKFECFKYVITLDSDTELPLGAALKMIGSMAHPLNKPEFDIRKKRVIRGYGILQPRIESGVLSGSHSVYARLYSGQTGLDSYATANHDLYQDLFNEGSFFGKGIYDIDTFHTAFYNTLPENRILSHDLLEGCYIRSGLLNDVQLYEGQPNNYYTNSLRKHRWIRGDWQIASWLFPIVPSSTSSWCRNSLSALSKWKIFDNLLRSLLPLILFLLLVSIWVSISNFLAAFLLTSVLATTGECIALCENTFRDIDHITSLRFWKQTFLSACIVLLRAVFYFSLLPYEVYCTCDAIMKSIWRLAVSKRRLLEWTPFDMNQKSMGLFYFYQRMIIQPFSGILFYWWSRYNNVLPEWQSIMISIVWSMGPFIAYKISLPAKSKKQKLLPGQQRYLRLIARKTWMFFQHFGGFHDNWLIPDHYQEYPIKRIAHRTSPTNIGFSLLANLSAKDFGFITMGKFLERTRNTFESLMKLERVNGHLYNWYDTQTLKPAYPKYISTVDSGNFISFVLVLQQALSECADQKILDSGLFMGLRDTCCLFDAKIKKKPSFIKLLNSIEIVSSLDSTGIEVFISSFEETKRLVSELMQEIACKKDFETEQICELLFEQLNDIEKECAELVAFVSDKTHRIVHNVINQMSKTPSLRQLLDFYDSQLNQDCVTSGRDSTEAANSHGEVELLRKARTNVKKRLDDILDLLNISSNFVNVEFNFLYDHSKNLMSIGFNSETSKRDRGCYDLLASESRLTAYLGICMGKLPGETWSAMRRPIGFAGKQRVLLSWDGSLFEYLMPHLIMPIFENSLLEMAANGAIKTQINFARKYNIPWGMSECGRAILDRNQHYEYGPHGIKQLGIRYFENRDYVVAPYASFLALAILPKSSFHNITRLSKLGCENKYGFYEAIQFFFSSHIASESVKIVKSYMSHHQGMSLLSLNLAVIGVKMHERFMSLPLFDSGNHLLQERVPKEFQPGISNHNFTSLSKNDEPFAIEQQIIPIPQKIPLRTKSPEIQLIGNKNYHIIISATGSGYSKWKNNELTRWREDRTCDNWGFYCYVKDINENTIISPTFQPMMDNMCSYEVEYKGAAADYKKTGQDLLLETSVSVALKEDVELRRIHIQNQSDTTKTIEIVSYAEVVIAPAGVDVAHPCFSNLFVQAELHEKENAILYFRRPSVPEEERLYLFQSINCNDCSVKKINYATDRIEFIGRGNSITNPQTLFVHNRPSAFREFPVDPIVSIAIQIKIEPRKSGTVDIVMGAGSTKEICLDLLKRCLDCEYRNDVVASRFDYFQEVCRNINASSEFEEAFRRLSSLVIYPSSSLRPIVKNPFQGGLDSRWLWRYSISEEIPIILVVITEPTDVEILDQLIKAQSYARYFGIVYNVVILNSSTDRYKTFNQRSILEIIAKCKEVSRINRYNGIYILEKNGLTSREQTVLLYKSRVVIPAAAVSLTDVMSDVFEEIQSKRHLPKIAVDRFAGNADRLELPELRFFNGFGGFSENGKEYIMIHERDKRPPLPWINVISNPHFGTVISDSGQSYSWFENSRLFRLTPWNNDVIQDLNGEFFYLRDENNSLVWSPFSMGLFKNEKCLSIHGFGYSRFQRISYGIFSQVEVYVDIDEPIKFVKFTITNHSGQYRNISITGYVEWILGESRETCVDYVSTEFDQEYQSIFAFNDFNKEFENRCAFFACNNLITTYTADRTEFIGRDGNVANPAGMHEDRFTGFVGAGVDPCGVIRTQIDLDEKDTKEILFVFGAAHGKGKAVNLLMKFKNISAANASLERVVTNWKQNLEAIQIMTPDKSMDFLFNGWLLYQTVSCRLYGRTSFYQSGGAIGFRDQLQDVLPLIHVDPLIARRHILYCAGRQFQDGDVLHWWHPPINKGVRTLNSDDSLWLPFVCCDYITQTQDYSILDEKISYLEGGGKNWDEETIYSYFNPSEHKEDLYQHCLRALRYVRLSDSNGLAITGSGDWNDSMNNISRNGKGESIWLSFFYYYVLRLFSKVALVKGDHIFYEECTVRSQQLKNSLDNFAWDGQWYLRAYYPDGSPLGSSRDTECKIDSLSQSWAVLSGAGDFEINKIALNSAYELLIDKKFSLIKLLWPAFDKTPLTPGYIKGYLPGVRENGGQYTHAAIWLMMAHVAIGENEKAWEMFHMINPINHGSSKELIDCYKVEPYVVAADVYATPLQIGRGGWTWYTGSSGWLYRAILEYFLGIQKRGNVLTIQPNLPADWSFVSVRYRYGRTIYQINLIRADDDDPVRVVVPLQAQEVCSNEVVLSDDGNTHVINVTWSVEHSKSTYKPNIEGTINADK